MEVSATYTVLNSWPIMKFWDFNRLDPIQYIYALQHSTAVDFSCGSYSSVKLEKNIEEDSAAETGKIAPTFYIYWKETNFHPLKC